MAEKFSGRIAKLTGRKVPAKTAFLTVREDVKQAVDEGWPLQAIWQALQKEQRVGFSYQTFCRLAKRHLYGPLVKGEGANGRVVRDAGNERTVGRPDQTSHRHQVDNKETTTGMRGFIYNPIPNEKELI